MLLKIVFLIPFLSMDDRHALSDLLENAIEPPIEIAGISPALEPSNFTGGQMFSINSSALADIVDSLDENGAEYGGIPDRSVRRRVDSSTGEQHEEEGAGDHDFDFLSHESSGHFFIK